MGEESFFYTYLRYDDLAACPKGEYRSTPCTSGIVFLMRRIDSVYRQGEVVYGKVWPCVPQALKIGLPSSGRLADIDDEDNDTGPFAIF